MTNSSTLATTTAISRPERSLGRSIREIAISPWATRDRNRPGRVVGLADEEEEEQRNGAGDADRTQLSAAEQGDHAGQPQRKEEEEVDAELDEVDDGAAAAPPMVGDVDEGGEALDDLPGEIRRPDEKRDRGGDPGVSRPQLRPQRRGEKDGDADARR